MDVGSIPTPPSYLFKEMERREVYDLYLVQSENVRELGKVKSNLVKDINFYIRKKDMTQVEMKTKLLGLLFCTFSEAQFIQILHTPDSFNSTEIKEIKETKNNSGIIPAWKKMIQIALSKVGNWQKNKDIQNRRIKLYEIIDKYLEPPSLIRNKLAHGQWVNALNRKNTKRNESLTEELKNLDFVEITKWFEVQRLFGFILRDLIQSPKKGFHNNYWVYITELESFLEKTKDWNFESKKKRLIRKTPPNNAHRQ